MPQAAHNFFEKELKPTLVDVFGEIHDFVTSGDEWYQIGVENEGDVEDCEWQDRDGFWSHNNGGVEMCFTPNTSILYNGSRLAPCIQKWVDDQYESCKEDAKEDEDYLAWKAEREEKGEESDVETWFAETCEGGDFENNHENNWMEAAPFCKVEAWLQGPDGYQFHGPVEPSTILKLHFEFCFNDDLGYGRPYISWCPGVGDHPKCEANIFFEAKDVEKVRELIKTKILEMAKCPDNEQREKEEFYTDGLDGRPF
jgi:hypothetical protein